MAARTYALRGEKIEIAARRDGDELILTQADGTQLRWQIRPVGDAEFAARETADTRRAHTVYAVRDRHACWVHLDGRTYRFETVVERGGGPAGAGSLAAPIPATVMEVAVANGDVVKEGQVLLVLSAMKMQLEIRAPHAGTVSGLQLSPDDRVDAGTQLLSVVADEEDQG